VNLTLSRDSPVKVSWVDRVGDALSTHFWTSDKAFFPAHFDMIMHLRSRINVKTRQFAAVQELHECVLFWGLFPIKSFNPILGKIWTNPAIGLHF